MSDLTPDLARVAGEQFLKNTSQQANIFLHTVSAYTKAFLDEVNAHEQRVHEAIAKEKENNSALKSLAGSIAHEMRNPLSQIHGFLYLIDEQMPNTADKEHIKSVRQIIQSASQFIDITMDAMAEKPIDRKSFVLLSARDSVEEAVRDYAYEESAHAKKVSVKGGDFKLMAKPVMVKHILYNLLQNALWYVKSLPDAEILISVMPNVDGVNQIEVRDTGPGIAADIIPKLFDPFYTSDKQGGTGLGLSYCKRTMSALGGDISCHSALGQYTAFVLSFPTLSAEKI
jgi:signal transduction histidine kinase